MSTEPDPHAPGQQPRSSIINRAIALIPDPRRVSALYVWVALIVIFSIAAPSTFPTGENAKTILNQQAVTALLAVALVVPLASGVYDLSVVYTMNLSAIVLVWILAHTGLPLGLAMLIAVLSALVCGLVNVLVVVKLKVDSFIGTLATGSVFLAIIDLITKQLDIGLSPTDSRHLQKLMGEAFGGITLPIIYLVVIAFAVWYLLEYTPTGRYLYATGSGRDAAQLAGLPTDRLRGIALMICAAIGGFAGIVVTARVGIASDTVGAPYLLPVFTAVFLGATQLKPGRFNVWGALIGVYLVATGTQGFVLVSAPVWVSEMFDGVVLIIAIALTGLQRRRRVTTE
jgi:ribose transport system permease protein